MKAINILLVEDNMGDVFLTQEAFEEKNVNCNLNYVKDGYDALRYLNKEAEYKNVDLPHLIFLDVNLPKLNGHEVLHQIKTNDQLKHIPVIMLSTSTAENDILKSYQEQANCYIVKPMDVNKFIDVIDSIRNFWTTVVHLPNDNQK